MSFRYLLLALPLAISACGHGQATPRGFSFLDPGVRAGQEQACATAVTQRLGVSAGSVQVDRTSADHHNGGTIGAVAGVRSGHCRVTGDFRVLGISGF